MSYDPKCLELAEYFMGAAPAHLTEQLAQEIQDSVEGWLTTEARTRLAEIRAQHRPMIGDQGQRYIICYSDPDEPGPASHILGYAPTADGAEQMARTWRKHPAGFLVWVEDRQGQGAADKGSDA